MEECPKIENKERLLQLRLRSHQKVARTYCSAVAAFGGGARLGLQYGQHAHAAALCARLGCGYATWLQITCCAQWQWFVVHGQRSLSAESVFA